MTKKIFLSIMTAVVTVLLASIFIIMWCLYDYFGSVQELQLAETLSYAATGVENNGLTYLCTLPQDGHRLTWIAADGTVLYDTQADSNSMENHAQRKEVRDALSTGKGTSARRSETMLEMTVYSAKLLSDGTVLRISVSRATMAMLLMGILHPVLIELLIALLLAFFLAERISDHIVAPLNRLDLDHPLEQNVYDELVPLLTRISQQRQQIDAQMQVLRHRKDEFDQVTASMNEGLVLLNEQGMILSINPAACQLLQINNRAVGQYFADIHCQHQFHDTLAQAMSIGHSETRLTQQGREYQLDVSRIQSDGAVIGAVLLSFDVTEQANAERSRREFTANVSHELKTPLTSILAAAELIETGLVKPEDLSRFAGHIHTEASRLLSLIEDIIRLSQLDEGTALPTESVNLDAVIQEIAEQLQTKAQQRDITISLSLQPTSIQSIPRLVHEIVYNLMDNAIKYNIPQGHVCVSTKTQENHLVMTISDTGIGIPAEHQPRIFERFYRVDKSHSRQSGGTGLGLSIVKHAAAYCGASITLDSQLGRGTTITVSFPLSKT